MLRQYPKCALPESEDSLRPISLTSDLSRDYNKLLVSWLLPYTQKHMDPAQLGGAKGNSITLALILYYHFIATNVDNVSRDKKSVIAAYIDMSKGFQKISHKNILIRLSDWGVPSWLLKIVASYLTGRSMVVNYKGKQSKAYLLPGSVAQGDELGQLLFLVAMSDVALPPAPPLPEPVHPGDISSCVLPLPPPLSRLMTS